MKVYCDCSNNIKFEALKIKPSRKLSKDDLAILYNSPELQKLVAKAEKSGIDILAEYYCGSVNASERGYICLKNSNDYTMGYYNIKDFGNGFFKSSWVDLQINAISKNPTGKSFKDYVRITLDKIKSLYKKSGNS